MTENIEETINEKFEPEVENIVSHPWRRYFARYIDIGVYGLIITYVLRVLFRLPSSANVLSSTLEFLLICILMLLFEPLLLSKLGTTPGKWILGLVLRTKENEKITYSNGLLRTFYIIKDGFGFGIPFYNMYRNYVSYRKCSDGEALSWDEGFSYKIADTKSRRLWAVLFSWLIIISISYLISVQVRLPINRGNISPEEYFENCNVFMKQNDLVRGELLSKDGKWIKSEDSDSTIHIRIVDLLDHSTTFENNKISKVTASVETSDKIIHSYSDQLLMVYSAFVGSDKSINGFELYDKDLISNFKTFDKNFKLELDNFVITRTVDIAGYQISDNYLLTKGDQKGHYHMIFEIRRK